MATSPYSPYTERPRTTTWRLIERVAILLGLLGLSFSAGENWHRLAAVEATEVQLSRDYAEIKAEYERKDVLDERLKRIDDQLADIRALMAEEHRR